MRKYDSSVSQIGQVEGKPVEIVLDTGCARTMVRKELVRPNKITDRQVSIHCAHGSSVTYPLVQVNIAIGDFSYDVEAAVSDQLPVPVLLGRDVPELLEMLQKPKTQNVTLNPDREMAWMTTTRSQRKKQTKQAIEDHQAEANNTILPTSSNNLTNPVTLNCEDINEEIPGSCFHEMLFQGGKIRQKLKQK